MLDIQAIYLRDTVPVKAVSGVLALEYETPAIGTPINAYIDGKPSVFLDNKKGKTYVVLPPTSNKQGGWSYAFDVATAGGLTTRVGSSSLAKPVVTILISVAITKPGTVAEVWINSQSAAFIQISSATILCELPTTDLLESIDVLTSAPGLGAVTGFTYNIVNNLQTVKGPQKLVFQFIKLLMTTQGSDVFHPLEGGNLQKIPGSLIELDGAGSLGSQILLAVNRTAAFMISGQVTSSLPPEERLTKASIGNLSIDANDPTSISVSLRLENLAREAAIFNFFTKLLGGA